MSRCVIVGGADIGDYETIKRLLRPDDRFIYCDGGLRHMEKLGREAYLIAGDFDSHPQPRLPAETIVLPREKDDTDTRFAVKEALSRGFSEFLLLGAAGGRLDHTLGNLSLLLMLDSLGKKALLADDFSEMEIVSRGAALVEPEYEYFSLLAIGGDAEGVAVENAKYPLRGAVISPAFQYGISNEPLPGMTARITLSRGALLLIKIRRV